ncbi:Uncharacterised protein [Acinetobacter baumannii]|nr:Uncharacterised protein [Acinetobacter baumannii]
MLSGAGAGHGRSDGRGLTADLADEGPGRSAAGQRRGGGLSELDAKPRAAAGGDGRLPQRAGSSAVYRAGTADAG